LVSMFSGPKKKEQSNNNILEKENPEENN